MNASACLTLALVNALVWWRRREAQANGIFALLALTVVVYAASELWLLRATTVEAYGLALRWLHVPVFVAFILLVMFVRVHLQAGRLWLAWAIVGTRAFSLLLNFVFTPNLNYHEITSLRPFRFLGETVFVGEGVPNPWMLVGQAAMLLLVIFVVDAMITVWRRDERPQARLLICAIALLIVMGTLQTLLRHWANLPIPFITSLFFSGVVLAMGLELSWNVIRAGKLVEDLKASEERFRQLTEAAFEGICISEHGKVCAINDQGLNMLGYQRNEMVGKAIAELVAPESRAMVADAVSTGQEGRYEHQLLRKDGSKFFVEAQAKMARVGNRTVRMTALRDITERKHAEATLAALAIRHQTLLQTAREGIHVLDEQGKVVEANAAFGAMLGYTQEEVLQLSVMDWDAKWSKAQLLEKIGVLMKHPAVFETRHRRKDGTLIDVEISAVSVMLEGRRYLYNAARDITERKRAEVALAQERNLLRTLMDHIPSMIFVRDLSNRFLIANQAFARRMGLATPAGLIGKTDADFFPTEDADRFAASDREIFAGGELLDYDFSPTFPNGEQLDVLVTKVPLKNAQGEVIGLVGVSHDITERKRAEAALRESEGRFRSLAEASLEGLLIHDRGLILDVNWAFVRLMGYERPEEMMGKNAIETLLTPESQARVIQRLQRQEEGVLEVTCVRKNGTMFVAETESRQLPYRGREARIVSLRDITEHKRAIALAEGQKQVLEMIACDAPTEDTLEALLRVIESAAKEMLCSILLLDRDGLHLRHMAAPSLPKAYCQAIDGEAIGPTAGSCGTAAYRREPVFVEDITTDPLWENYKAVALPHGLRACWSTPLFDAQRNVLGTFAVYYRHPGLPSEHHRRLIELATHTAAIAIGRQRAKTALQESESRFRQSQKMEGIGQLAGGVAHDFNNILAALLMQTDLVATVEQLPAEARAGLQEIRSDVQRAAELTRQLLLFSRRQVMQPKLLNLNDLVMNLGKLLQRIIGEDVHLQLHLHPVALMTRADAGMLEQVLMNLCVNARDAMPGGGSLLIQTTETEVDEEAARLNLEAAPGRYVALGVSDTGSGIPPEILPKIFEPFFTTKEAGKGTGLGLATVFGIVKQHQGWIKVDNRPGQGVTFQVFLPASTEPAVEGAPAEAKPQPRGGTETILVVEDEAVVRKLVRKILERHGYNILEASNGVEALQRWEDNRGTVALLLTDLVMPGGMSGQELARQLVANQPQLKVIYTSGYSADIAGREFQLRPGEAFLQKPCPTAQLVETVRRSLDD